MGTVGGPDGRVQQHRRHAGRGLMLQLQAGVDALAVAAVAEDEAALRGEGPVWMRTYRSHSDSPDPTDGAWCRFVPSAVSAGLDLVTSLCQRC
jgi:hypothetical protein